MIREQEQVSGGRATAVAIAGGAAERSAEDEVLRRIAAPAGSRIPLPRLLVVLAHPDDEVLAVGGRLERLRDSYLLCVTDGAPEDGADARAHGFDSLEAYRKARRAELEAALRLAGLEPPMCAGTVEVDCGDGVGRQVPDQKAALHLTVLTRAIRIAIERFRPEAVLTHPYEGGHPDHDSCAFAVHTAVRSVSGSKPLVVETPFYHAGPNGIETGVFLEGGGMGFVRELSGEEQARKRERLECFTTQQDTLKYFDTAREQFRFAPAYDFTEPAHRGTLFYERFPWGMTGERFRELASAALSELNAESGMTADGESGR